MTHHYHEEHGGGNTLWAFLLGGLVGAAAAVLLAPKSGRETREDIKNMADSLKTRVSGYAGDVKEAVSDGVRKGREAVSDRKSMLKSALEAGREAYLHEKERTAEQGGNDRETPEQI